MIVRARGAERRVLVLKGLLLLAAAGLLLASWRLPWWSLTMYAPQYPQGLTITTTLVGMSGDVDELNGLNHYIGMMPLENAAPFERSLVGYAVPTAVGLAVAAIMASGVLAWLLVLPLVSFPFVFAADLYGWLYYAGHHLDPKAALSSSIGGFTPTMVGEGVIAQFRTVGAMKSGFYLALLAAALAVMAIRMSRRQRGGDQK